MLRGSGDFYCPMRSQRDISRQAFTLAEVVLGIVVLTIALTAILGAYVGQVTLNEHARNLSLAIQDANRVIEQIRQITASGCSSPSLNACPIPGVTCSTTWDTWLNNTGGGKSIPLADTPFLAANERIVVTCQAQGGGNAFCAPNQLNIDASGGEGGVQSQGSGTHTAQDPMRITVAVCWRHRGRIIGECSDSGGGLQADETVVAPNEDENVIQSPAMLTTLVTCRG